MLELIRNFLILACIMVIGFYLLMRGYTGKSSGLIRRSGNLLFHVYLKTCMGIGYGWNYTKEKMAHIFSSCRLNVNQEQHISRRDQLRTRNDLFQKSYTTRKDYNLKILK